MKFNELNNFWDKSLQSSMVYTDYASLDDGDTFCEMRR